MKKKLLTILFFVLLNWGAFGQWTGHSSASDLTSTISRTGNVGIGNSPTQALDVTGRLKFRALGSGSAGIWFTGNSGTELLFVGQSGLTSSDPFGIYHNGAWRFTINQNGNVGLGLGEETPTQRLDVNGRVKFRASGSASSGVWFTDASGTESAFIGQTGNTSAYPLGIYHSGYWRFVVDQNGKVGIGTESPEAKLHVSTAIMSSDPNFPSINVRMDGTSIPMIRFSRDTDGSRTTYHNAFIGQFFNTNYNNYSLGIGTSIDGDQNGNGTKVITIPMNGNVGIGTTSPDHKLTVDGTIKCEEVKVELFTGTGPDYVFGKEYDLLSLSELEIYINQNKHLPEVPSAKEMEANGLNLKEMNLLLLKKVEELTLHLIQKDRQIERLQNQNQKIESRLQKIENQ